MELATLTVTAQCENLATVVEFCEAQADLFDLEPRKKFGLLIAVEEAFVNICHYAYAEGEGVVELFARGDDATLIVEIADHGTPFDVLSLPEPETTAGIMDREIGGLGVHFIRKLTDSVNYRRSEGKNILQMTFQRTPAADT
jgi:anti-sigma regulatory factor (Ser/Thr protein kinase)